MQFSMPQMNIDPLLVGIRSVRGTLLRHPLPILNASKLLIQVSRRVVKRSCRYRLDGARICGIPKSGPECQGDQPAPGDESNQAREPIWSPVVAKWKSVKREFNEPSKVPQNLCRRPIAELAQVACRRSR